MTRNEEEPKVLRFRGMIVRDREWNFQELVINILGVRDVEGLLEEFGNSKWSSEDVREVLGMLEGGRKKGEDLDYYMLRVRARDLVIEAFEEMTGEPFEDPQA
jgi:hypothetical protein